MKPQFQNLNEIPGVFSGKALGEEGHLELFQPGSIAQVYGNPGSGKTETVLRFLAERAELSVAWVEDEFTIYPSAFPQYGVALDRVHFVDVAGLGDFPKVLRALQQIISSKAFSVCIVSLKWAKHLDAEGQGTALRRLQLAAEKARVALILISEEPISSGGSWPVAVLARAERDASGKAGFKILKRKRGAIR